MKSPRLDRLYRRRAWWAAAYRRWRLGVKNAQRARNAEMARFVDLTMIANR